MPHFQVNGINLFADETGEGPAIVFAHGRGGNHMSWWQQVPAFADRFRCITFDHRSFGMSYDLPEGPGQDAFIDDLESLLDQLKVSRTVLVAQSMGGYTALGFALRNPARVAGLVLADTTAGVAIPEILMAREEVGYPPQLMDRVLSPKFQRKNPQYAFLYRQIEAVNHIGKEPAPRSRKGLNGGATRKDLQGCSVPTLFIAGTEDVITPPRIVGMLAQLIPGARLEIIRDAGHSAYFEKPEEFNWILERFLDELEYR